ncbi:hypothetical protein [Streptoalloteichus tenebrarius]|uniref:hypothetical protein n=1 Tax=Streptoalloteichus tenebrarius (strain ATCC 17920 / DSM 40477 / JCM 4838 / CBS 697.72 / NBRC 16177 / NCIMB 11028 / NRRL B-12390 / A12253. 1 / ISP 5477) TaxID=1933 RepID=UPI0020A31B67|nr:hypothetical protein [Streptoalloteichus tenebrarius]BFF00857.1 hypothetical protein GCM10020241_25320 [Streptoalloteichus tenebrarius]
MSPPPRSARWLPLVAALLLVITGCQPQERGRILVGRDRNDVVVAVLGTCAGGEQVELVITNRAADGEVARARTRTTGRVLRVGLYGPPPGWDVARWDLVRSTGRVQVNATVTNGSGEVTHRLQPTVVDLDRVRPLDAGADDDAQRTC